MSSQPWRMPKACISWLVLAGDLVRSEWWLKRFHSPRKEVFILHVLSLVQFNDLYFLCTDWCHLHVFQSEKMRLLTIISRRNRSGDFNFLLTKSEEVMQWNLGDFYRHLVCLISQGPKQYRLSIPCIDFIT